MNCDVPRALVENYERALGNADRPVALLALRAMVDERLLANGVCAPEPCHADVLLEVANG